MNVEWTVSPPSKSVVTKPDSTLANNILSVYILKREFRYNIFPLFLLNDDNVISQTFFVKDLGDICLE